MPTKPIFPTLSALRRAGLDEMTRNQRAKAEIRGMIALCAPVQLCAEERRAEFLRHTDAKLYLREQRTLLLDMEYPRPPRRYNTKPRRPNREQFPEEYKCLVKARRKLHDRLVNGQTTLTTYYALLEAAERGFKDACEEARILNARS